MARYTYFYKKFEISNKKVNNAVHEHIEQEMQKLTQAIEYQNTSYNQLFNVNELKLFKNDLIKFKHNLNTHKRAEKYLKAYYAHNVYDFLEDNKELLIYIHGKGFYLNVSEFYDIFRCDWSNKLLFNLEDSISHINNPKNNCLVFEDTFERLKKAWETYPNGVITLN